MLSVVYISSARRKFSEADLVALLEQSREKNAGLDITGMLLYQDGNIMQVLEGPDAAVRQLMKTIEADDRHHDVLQLSAWQYEERQFPDWTMGFKNLNDPAVRELPGYSEFLNESLCSETFRAEPGRARRLLEMFRRNMR